MTATIPITSSSKKYMCPVSNIETEMPCLVRKCMYHVDSSSRGCGYAQLTSAVHKEGITKDNKKKAVCDFFSLEEEDLAVSIRRIIAVLCTNEFFNHVYEKSIMDARPKELAALAEDEARYESWRPNAKKIGFKELVATLEFLKNNLR